MFNESVTIDCFNSLISDGMYGGRGGVWMTAGGSMPLIATEVPPPPPGRSRPAEGGKRQVARNEASQWCTTCALYIKACVGGSEAAPLSAPLLLLLLGPADK